MNNDVESITPDLQKALSTKPISQMIQSAERKKMINQTQTKCSDMQKVEMKDDR